jgi:anaerobic dimethyl sulfoxide reductase subunit B (iron-sulfur subunit)
MEKPIQKGFYLDLTRCTSCYACVVACKAHHAIEEETVYWRRVLTFEQGTYPFVRLANLSLSCLHCAVPACSVVCPTKAIYKRKKDGLVFVDPNYCIGCKICLMVCPFGVPQFGRDGKMQKCNFCIDRVEGGLPPACVSVCPARALHAGSIEELSVLAARKSASRLVHRIEPAFFV